MTTQAKAVVLFGSLGFLLLSAILFWLLLPACGALPIYGSLFRDFCPAPAVAASPDGLRAAQEAQAELDSEIASLERRLANLHCAAPTAPPIQDFQRCWTVNSNYSVRGTESGEDYGVESWRICIGEDGQGEQSMEFENGVQCSGPVTVEQTGNSLLITDVEKVMCANGFAIEERITRCRIGSNGRALCQQSQPSVGDDEWPVSLIEEQQSNQ